MTSARPESQEIIEVALVKFIGDRVMDTYTTLVSPNGQLPYGIQVLTGIRPQELARAPRLDTIAPRIRAFIGEAPLVAHSVSADVGALDLAGIALNNQQIDTFELATILLPRLESYSLASLVRHFDINHEKQHRALPDAQVTRQLFLKLLNRIRELDLSIIREINEMTASLMWPLRAIFIDIEEERARTPRTAGTSIRDVLAAKMGTAQASLDAALAREEIEPLQPRSPRRLIDRDAMNALLNRDGAVAHTIAGFEERPQQAAMLGAVVTALNDGGALLVEAGTGTGKSMAYLLPVIAFAARNDERVVISTNTINLQEQLFAKDIPDARSALSEDFRATILKGRQNYLCFERWTALRRRPDLTTTEIMMLVKILVWLPQTETGDIGELNMSDADRTVWSRLCSNPEICSPQRCASIGKRGCFLQYARERAAGSHITVVNHALLLSDIASGNAVIPEYRFLVVDEAHHLETQATTQLGFNVRLRDVVDSLDSLSLTSADKRSGLANELGHAFRGAKIPESIKRNCEAYAQDISREVENCRAAATVFFGAIGSFLKANGSDNRGYDQRTRVTVALRLKPGWKTVEESWDALAVPLSDLHAIVTQLQTVVGGLGGSGIAEFDNLLGQMGTALRFNEDLRREGSSIIAERDEDRICWGSVANNEVGLHAAPLRVGPLLKDLLFDQKETSILTSATLTTDGSFAFIRENLGLESAAELQVGSPFDYASSTIVCLPTDVSEPDRPDYASMLSRSLIDVCLASGGRMMVLFTAHTQLRQAYHAIKGPLESRGILVLGHGVDGTPRRHLLQAFKNNSRSILLGASSFWEGVDVIGDGLSVLAIAKLPFPVPTDPIVSARSELFTDPFSQYSVPSTILRLKQGFGRLIRSKSDRGIVICYDRRLLTKGYGKAFLRSLPPADVIKEPLAAIPRIVAEFLGPTQPNSKQESTAPRNPPEH